MNPRSSGSPKRQYCENFCEENIWQLAGEAGFEQSQVVFISNPSRSVVFWQQRICKAPDQPVTWDYHVVLLNPQDSGWAVWDLDTGLPCPSPATDYLTNTFPHNQEIPSEWRPMFSLIPAALFRSSFSSDRRHMRQGEKWLSPPPEWPAPTGDGSDSHNLDRFISMKPGFIGKIMTLAKLVHHVSGD